VTVHDLHDAPPPDVGFVERLTLRRIDTDIFLGWCHAGSPLRAFGGQVAAQALVAAGTTVEQPGRQVHSLHAYFLRGGSTTDHIVYQVDRLRDGRSFSTRRVRAVQYGKTIFAMSASFSDPMSGPEHHPDGSWISDVTPPQDVPKLDLTEHLGRSGPLEDNGYPRHEFIDIRFLDHDWVRDFSHGHYDRMAWVRADEVLPDASLYHVCALTYFSDLSMVGTVLGHHGGSAAHDEWELASIDHAMWFHNAFRADDWLLFATRSPIAGFGQGFATGQFFDARGVLVASAAQEVLMRQPRA
jgi:acyl-CoA thioesterase-2